MIVVGGLLAGWRIPPRRRATGIQNISRPPLM
jgi:hypothetical protein